VVDSVTSTLPLHAMSVPPGVANSHTAPGEAVNVATVRIRIIRSVSRGISVSNGMVIRIACV
jgi:hypothetical protein